GEVQAAEANRRAGLWADQGRTPVSAVSPTRLDRRPGRVGTGLHGPQPAQAGEPRGAGVSRCRASRRSASGSPNAASLHWTSALAGRKSNLGEIAMKTIKTKRTGS